MVQVFRFSFQQCASLTSSCNSRIQRFRICTESLSLPKQGLMRQDSDWQGHKQKFPASEMLPRLIHFAARAGDSKSAFAQWAPFFTLYQSDCHQPEHMQGFPGTNHNVCNPLGSAASAMGATAGVGRAAVVFVCVPAPAGSRLQRAHQAHAGQQGANMLLSQHALIGGTDISILPACLCSRTLPLLPARHFRSARRLGPLLLAHQAFTSLLTA